jgi:hypothetical protein
LIISPDIIDIDAIIDYAIIDAIITPRRHYYAIIIADYADDYC